MSLIPDRETAGVQVTYPGTAGAAAVSQTSSIPPPAPVRRDASWWPASTQRWPAARKLEHRRQAALLRILGHSQAFEEMVQRAEVSGEALDEIFLERMRERFRELEESAARRNITIDQLGALEERARCLAQLKAYVCPQRDVAMEGRLCLDQLAQWEEPVTVIDRLRRLLVPKLEAAASDLASARAALRALYAERDAWEASSQEYEKAMGRYTFLLLQVTLVAILLAVAGLYFSPLSGLTLPLGMLSAGIAGGCISVMTRLPTLDIGIAGHPERYARRILSRIGVGGAASLAGCALLGSGLLSISIQGTSFGDVVAACSAGTGGSCSSARLVVILGTALVLGLSERVLPYRPRGVPGRPEGRRPVAAGTAELREPLEDSPLPDAPEARPADVRPPADAAPGNTRPAGKRGNRSRTVAPSGGGDSKAADQA